MVKMKGFVIFLIFLGLHCEISNKVVDEGKEQIKVFINDIVDYGNYCGPYNDKKNQDPVPTDDLDGCCEKHDARWGDAKKDKDYLVCGEGLRSELDAEFVECLELLDKDSTLWENPPLDFIKAENYTYAAILLFTPCMVE